MNVIGKLETSSLCAVSAIVLLLILGILVFEPERWGFAVMTSLPLFGAVLLSPKRSLPLLIERSSTGHTAACAAFAAFVVLVMPAESLGERILAGLTSGAIALFGLAVAYWAFRHWSYRGH